MSVLSSASFWVFDSIPGAFSSFFGQGMSGTSSTMPSKVSLDAPKNFLFLLSTVSSSLLIIFLKKVDRTSTFFRNIPLLHQPARSYLLWWSAYNIILLQL